MSVPAACRELAACAGEQFDPAIARAFLNMSLGGLWWDRRSDVVDGTRPIIGPVQRAGGQLAAAASGATAAVDDLLGGPASPTSWTSRCRTSPTRSVGSWVPDLTPPGPSS